MKNKEKKYLKIKNVFKIFLIIIISILIYARFIGTSGLKVKEYYIKNESVPESFNGFKIVQFSDLHFGMTTDFKSLDNIIKKINNLNPDLVIFTGDLIDKNLKLSKKDTTKLIEYLSNINANIKKIGVKGNHDYNKNNDFNKIMYESGFEILCNSYDLIYYKGLEPIYIAGFPSSIKEQYDIEATFNYFTTLTENDIKPNYIITLMHEPDNIDDLLDKNINLVLAGHSHNGQIRLPFVGALITPAGSKKYYDEYYKVSNTDLYISSGIGTSSMKFRFNNRPSINFYRLSNK